MTEPPQDQSDHQNGQDDDNFEHLWNSRIAAMAKRLGPCGDMVLHAVIPYFLGGNADIVMFPNHLPDGVVYVTSDLTGEASEQIPNQLGQYELAICLKDRDEPLLDVLTCIPRVTEVLKFEALETADIFPNYKDQSIKAFIFFHLNEQPLTFRLENQACGVLFFMGITQEELDYKQANGSEALIEQLKTSGVYPMTIPGRASTITTRRPWYRFW